MNTFWTVLLIILAVLVVIVAILYFLGRKAEKKQADSQQALDAAAQTMSLFIIDKKKVKLKDAGLPKVVLDSTPKYLRGSKMPVLKVKVGPRVMTLICDAKIFSTILPKQEVKATVSGIYVTSAKRIRGPVYEKPKSKKEQRRLEKEAKKKNNK